MPNDFVDLTVTSPPYDDLRNYKGYSFDFENIAKELFRVTKEGGIVVWIINDSTIDGSETLTSCKQKIFLKEQCGFNIHDTMIYQRKSRNPINKRYSQDFEYMFVLSKGIPKTINFIKQKTSRFKSGRFGIGREIVKSRNKKGELITKIVFINKDTPISNIWNYEIAVNYTKDKIAFKHPAIFPEQLAVDHIISWSNKEDLVYDPFMGSGTTAVSAMENNRNYIGSEISSEYCKIAKQRIEMHGKRPKPFF